MRITRMIAAAAAMLLAASIGTAAAATSYVIEPADDNSVGDECVPTDAWVETIPPVGEPTLPNPEYVAPWVETIDHPAVVEYKWALYTVTGVAFAWATSSPGPDWLPFPTTAAQWSNVVTPAWVETVEHPAVGEPTVPNPEYVPESYVEHPAVVCDEPAPPVVVEIAPVVAPAPAAAPAAAAPSFTG